MQGMQRQYLALVREYLGLFPCVVIVGARQTGKSTLIGMLADDRELFDLEARADYDQIAADPDLFLRLNPGPIAIDEAQLLPALFPALRVAIDRRRDTAGQYLLSGSGSPALMSAISESLAGRVGIIEMAPLSFAETGGVASAPGLFDVLFDHNRAPRSADAVRALWDQAPPPHADADQRLARFWFEGGYPEPWLKNSARFGELWREQYLQTYVERDIARLFPGLNPIRFRRFVELLAGCSGSVINYSGLAEILAVSQPTVKDYFRIAHGTFIWRAIPAYSKNSQKRVSRRPRGYLRDSGLLHHLLHIPSRRRLLSHPQMGASWEGMVIEEILRGLQARGVAHSAYYYRTAAGAEVDLLLEGKFGLLPFEIKHARNVNPRRLRALRDFVREFNCPFGIVINNDEKIRRYDTDLIGLPFAWLAR